MSTPSSVLVGNLGRTVWLKVEGRGTFQNSPGVKEFVKQMIQRGSRDFVVDLGACELMDSTFMGTLAGVALRLREIGQGSLRAVNVNPRNSSLLENLGLDQLFTVESSGADAPIALHPAAPVAAAPDDQKETVLSAHEALVEADAQNAVKFKDVIDYLRQELAQDAQPED
ncbi:MAG: STAS domain-containing protein [Terrimicrobiaceae bacterium]|nr:STAS domain-containing protein [Terrimicrobiaceae bacterium]